MFSNLCAATDPKKHPDVIPDEVRDIDFLWAVVLADVHVNWLDPVAHGNAIEEGWGEMAHAPAIYCIPESMRLSRLPKGMINVDEIIWYENEEGAYGRLAEIFGELGGWIKGHANERPLPFFAERYLARKKQ